MRGPGETSDSELFLGFSGDCIAGPMPLLRFPDGVADDLTRTAGVPAGRIRVILNPVITPALIAAAGDRPAHPWFEDTTRPIIISAGRLVPQKNFSLLIESFAVVRRRFDVRLVILGEGPDRARARSFNSTSWRGALCRTAWVCARSVRVHGTSECVRPFVGL